MTTIKIKEVVSDSNGVGVILEIDDGEGLVMDSSVFFTFEQFKDITTWAEFYTTLLKPSALPLIERFKKVKAVGTILTSKIGQEVTI